MSTKVQIEHLKFGYGGPDPEILRDISFTAMPGEITAIVGPNGTGKTTLLKCISNLLSRQGRVLFDGRELSREEMIQKMSYMEQDTDCPVSLSVFEVVMLGLVSRLGFRVSDEDISKVNEVLELVGIRDLAGKNISEISGGQRQLAFIAQALVKEPDVLILDEPTSALDLFNQFTLVNFIKKVTREKNCTTIVTLHHLDVALKYSDRVVVLNKGSVYCDTSASEAFTEEMLYDVYRVFSKIEVDENGDKHLMILRPRVKTDPGSWDELVNGRKENAC